jgi:hypothetical protein
LSATSNRMRRATLPEKAAIAAILLVSACTSDHRVSPWGAQPGPSLSPFVPRPDLDARLAAIDRETAALGLSRSAELRVDLPRGGGPAVIRGYEGHDVAGRPVHAVRVATSLGVVLAVGPLDVGDLARREATELVPALVGGAKPGERGAFQTGTDLNGDGRTDVILRNDSGKIAIWHFDVRGSGEYAVEMVIPPSRGADLDGDGRADLIGEIESPSGDPIAPRFSDMATFEGGRYASSKRWHAARAGAISARKDLGDAARLRASLERAWHVALAGTEPAENVLKALGREPVPPTLRAAFERHVRAIAKILGLR